MSIRFTKMHALGNDFMVIDAVTQNFIPNPELIRQWSHRNTGVGFDQLLIAGKAHDHNTDFFYRIFNADGSETAQCGNGACCLAKFLHDEKLTTKNSIYVQTLANTLQLRPEKNDQVAANIGVPVFDPAKIPFITDKQATTYLLDNFTTCVLSIGNPHCILLVENIDNAHVQKLGSVLAKHKRFPEGTNVEFMQIVNRQQIRLRVYERGVGETQACGSGACAAVVAGRLLNLLDAEVKVDLPGGQLSAIWQGDNTAVFLTVAVTTVYKGVI